MLNKTLNKIIRYPEKIPCDKRMHFMVGVVAVAMLTIFTLSVWLVIPTLTILSWGIEYFQKWTKSGTYDNYDALAVMAGGLTVYLSHIIGGL